MESQRRVGLASSHGHQKGVFLSLAKLFLALHVAGGPGRPWRIMAGNGQPLRPIATAWQFLDTEAIGFGD